MPLPVQHITVYTDGGSRGNPGPAAYGYVVQDAAGEILAEGNRYIGVATNNQAEYQGIVAALGKVLDLHIQLPVECLLDSELVVRQINGIYRIKNPALKPWLERIHNVIKELNISVTFRHIPREENKEADRLVNLALDGVESE